MLGRCFDQMRRRNSHLQRDVCVSTVGSIVSDVNGVDSVCHIVSEYGDWLRLDTLQAFVFAARPHLLSDIN